MCIIQCFGWEILKELTGYKVSAWCQMCSCQKRVDYDPNALCRRLSELGPYYAVVAARKDPAASAIRAQMREAAGRLGLACAAAATAKAAPESAKGSGPSQHQEGPAGSRRFTPAQRAVAVALVEVMQSAMRDGKEAALAARLTLANNTPAARPFLATLPKNGQLLTVHQLEHRASDQLLENLTQLAQQCAAAHSQPLEVFTRSMQSSMRTAAADSIAIMRGLYERQHMFVARRWYQEVRRAFQQPGGPTAFALLFLACGIIVLHVSVIPFFCLLSSPAEFPASFLQVEPPQAST